MAADERRFKTNDSSAFIRVHRRPERVFQQPARTAAGPAPSYSWSISREDYLRKVAASKAYIVEGQSYEICLTNKLHVTTDIPALEYFETLRKLNPAPQSAYLRLGDIEVASSSPER